MGREKTGDGSCAASGPSSGALRQIGMGEDGRCKMGTAAKTSPRETEAHRGRWH